MRRFSLLAGVALVVVLLTGVARAIPEVGAPANLIHTSFGITLLVKVGLVCVLVALGALNHFVFVPTPAAARPRCGRCGGRSAARSCWGRRPGGDRLCSPA